MAEEWNICDRIAKFREELAKLPEEDRPYWDDLYDKYLILADEYDMLKEMGIPYREEKARKEERERCAKVCEAEHMKYPMNDWEDGYYDGVKYCAEAIRKMENQ